PSRCFFPAEDGIRSRNVTGVQTCARPILPFLIIQNRALEHLLIHSSPFSQSSARAMLAYRPEYFCLLFYPSILNTKSPLVSNDLAQMHVKHSDAFYLYIASDYHHL